MNETYQTLFAYPGTSKAAEPQLRCPSSQVICLLDFAKEQTALPQKCVYADPATEHSVGVLAQERFSATYGNMVNSMQDRQCCPSLDMKVLRSDTSGEVLGYRISGNFNGPQLAVAGINAAAISVFKRILSIPTLPWMRGRLLLVHLDRLDRLGGEARSLNRLGTIDRTLILPLDGTGVFGHRLVLQGTNLVFNACAELGMISGRGVRRRQVHIGNSDTLQMARTWPGNRARVLADD